MIGEPPSSAGALNATDTCPFPGVPTTPVGAPGTAAGVTDADASLSGPSPDAFVACTVNVYPVPFVNPLTVIGEPEPVPVAPSGVAVTV